MTENTIELRNVSKSFKNFQITDLNLPIKKGYITGFIGPNGSGKTTTIKMIMNLISTYEGEIKIFGQAMKDNEKAIKERIGFVYSEDSYYDHLTVKETAQLVAPFYSSWQQETFDNYVELFNLPLKKKVKKLSTGMKVKLSLSIALSHQADLIIMDEPTSGLDPIVRSEVIDILHELIQDDTKTIFFSTHITTDLDKIADYLVFINEGELVFNAEKDVLLDSYKIVKGKLEQLDNDLRQLFVHLKETSLGFEGLTLDHAVFTELYGNSVQLEPVTIEDLMVAFVKGAPHAHLTK